MLRTQFVNGSLYRVMLPKPQEKQEVLALAQAFTRYENDLPPAEHTPLTGMIEAILAQAIVAHLESQRAEGERRAASEALKRLDAAALAAVRQIRQVVGGYFAQTPERAYTWGFTVRQTGRTAGHILMPHGQEEVRSCLGQYIEAELARPASEQFTAPALVTMVALREDIQLQWQTRSHAEQRRLKANVELDRLCQQLVTQLRLALSYLIMTRFEGQSSRELGDWGFKIVSRTATNPTAPNGQPEAAPTPETVLELG